MMVDTVIKYYWLQIITLYVSKIKTLFSKTPLNMQEIIQGALDAISTNDMEQMEIDD